MYDSLEVVSYYENKSYCVYDVKIEVFSVQRLQVGESPYIFLSGNPQLNNESNNFGSTVLCTCDSAIASLDDMRFLNSAVDGLRC